MFNGLNVFCDVDFEVIRGVGWGEGSTLHGRAWRSEKAGACWGIKIGSRAKLWCFAAVGAGLSLESPARRTPEDGALLAPAAAGVSAPRFLAPQGLARTGEQGGAAALGSAAAGSRLALPLAGAPGEGGTRRKGAPAMPGPQLPVAASSPPPPRNGRPQPL